MVLTSNFLFLADISQEKGFLAYKIAKDDPRLSKALKAELICGINAG